MKILVAGTYGERNGIETYTRHLVGALAGAGHDVRLVDRSPAGRPSAGSEGSILRFSPRSWPVWRVVGPFEAVRVRRALAAAVRDHAPDVVHLTYPEFAVASDRPTVMTAWHPETTAAHRARTARERGENRRLAGLFALNDRAALRRAAAIVATTPSVARAHTRSGRRLRWIPPFLPDESLRVPQGDRSRECVMVAGALDDPRKGLDLALRSVAELRRNEPDVRLVLVGGWRSGGPPTLPDFCDLRGTLSAAEVATTLHSAGCLVLPSVWEEFGYVALEALAAGTPVASSPLHGFEDLDTAGLVIAKRRDPTSMAAAIAGALTTRTFAFPDVCRASAAVRAIEGLYAEVLA